MEKVNQPCLAIPLAAGLTKGQEFGLTLVIAYEPTERTEWWNSLIQWARGIATPKRFLQGFRRWLILAILLEFNIDDQFRLKEEQKFASIPREANGGVHFTKAYQCLQAQEWGNLNHIPDIPPEFLAYLYDTEEHPLLAFLQCLGFIALGKTANDTIYHMWADSPTGRDAVAYILAKEPPKGIKDKINWDKNYPFERILERDFPQHKGRVDDNGIPWTEDKDTAAQLGISSRLDAFAKQPVINLLKASSEGWLVKSLQKTINIKLVDLSREENPQLAALWKKAVSKNKPRSPKERNKLMEKVKRQYEQQGIKWESLDEEIESKDGKTYTRLDLIPDEHERGSEHVERRLTLDALKKKAGLTKRQEMVIDLTCEDVEDGKIVLALIERFKKPTSEGNVRKLRYDAIEKLKESHGQ